MSSNRVVAFNQKRQEELELESVRRNQSNIHTLEYMAATGMIARWLGVGRIITMGLFRSVMFGAITAFQLVDLGLVLRQASLERQLQGTVKNSTLLKLVTNFLTFGATTAALLGAIIAPALFVVMTPALLVAGIGLKALVDFGTAATLLVRSFRTSGLETAEQRSADRYDAGRKLLSGLLNSAITLSLVFVAPFASAPFAVSLFLAIGGAVTGVALSAMTKHRRATVNLSTETVQTTVNDNSSVPLLSSTAKIQTKVHYGLVAPSAVQVINPPPAVTSSLYNRPTAAAQNLVTSNTVLTHNPDNVTISQPTRSTMRVG